MAVKIGRSDEEDLIYPFEVRENGCPGRNIL